MPSISAAALQSSSHYEVVMALSDGLLAMVSEEPAYGGERVANALRRVRDIIWAVPEKDSIAFSTTAERRRTTVYREVLLGLNDDTACKQFLEAYARLGHLYEIASLVARENVINRELEGFAPGGVREFVTSCASAQQAAEALSKPIFEMVMTAHPTNVNALDSIKAQRALGQVIDAARTGMVSEEAAGQALRHYLETPLLHGESGEMDNLTVQDETEFTLYYLNNLYDDLPAIYAGMDDALRRKGSYDPLALDLKLRFGSWGSSGDKDGNAQVTADTTLDAIARHSCAILDRYTESLQTLGEPALQPWFARIDSYRQETAELQRRIAAIGKNGGIPPRQFDELSKELATCTLVVHDFEQAVAQLYRDAGRQEVLDLLRRIRIFGGTFAKIEYRETAQEYTRVVGELIDGYLGMSLQKREALLTRLLQEPQKIAALYAAARPHLVACGAGRPYSNDDAVPIAYQTLKRMELARDFSHIIRDNVLAEFTHPSQLLEAMVLQQAVRENGSAAQLGVVPLFESPESMAEAASIMAHMWKNPVYRMHMQVVASREGIEQPIQEVQIAHSDNARRSGLPAARAFIHATHRELREAAQQHGVALRFFEGGSSSDIYRGGVRATSAAVRAYGLHDFAKFTFQGGDMLNYLNYTPSTKRLFVRNFAHSAAFHVHKVELASTTAWDSKESAPRLAVRDRQMTAMADEIVCTALKSTLGDYRDNAFTRTGLGHLLRELEYDEEKLAGAAGSRAPSRGGKSAAQEIANGTRLAFRRVGGTHMAEAQAVDIHKTRTITFSEALQHGGLVPTIVGSRTIYKNLRREINALRAIIRRKEQQGDALTSGELALSACYALSAPEDAQLPAGVIRFLFRQSRLLRDVVIRLAIGVALTDFDMMRISHPHLRNDPFLDQLENECREAANIVCAAFTGKFPEDLVPGKRGRAGFDVISTNRLRYLMVARFPEMQQVLEDKSRYLSFLQVLKADARERARHGAGMDAYCRRLAHAAGDTVTHGRMVPTDDPAYGRYVRHKLRSAQRQEEMQTA